MRKHFSKIIVILFALELIFANTGWCKDNYFVRVAQKFGRGMYNCAYCAFEIPKSIEKGFVRDEIYKMVLLDPVRGGFYTIGRAGVGLYEMLTFYVPQKPIMHPVYITEGTRDWLTYERKAESDGP